MSDLMLDVDQASELKAAFRRGNWTNGEIKKLSEGDMLLQVRMVLQGAAQIVFAALVTIINRVKAFSPAEFIDAGWTMWRGPADGNGLEGEEAQDVRSLALSEIDWSKVSFPTCLLGPDRCTDAEVSITGEEKLKRLVASGKILLDAGVFLALWIDYKANGDNSVLERLRRERGITYLDFFGTILRYSDGGRGVLYLYWGGGEWGWDVDWLGNGWNARHGSAVLD